MTETWLLASKFVAVYPATKFFGHSTNDGMYTTLLMSTGLTFGSISAIYGLTHQIIDTVQYSYLVAAVVASAVIPTLIANKFYLPKHLLGLTGHMDVVGSRVAAPVPASNPVAKGGQ